MKRCNNCFVEYEEEYDVCPHCGYVEGSPARELYHLYPGMVLNERYIVGQVLGFGGFGIIYKVWDTKLENIIAIKEYYPNGMVNRIPGTKEVRLVAKSKKHIFEHDLTRFLSEARSMARFSDHKHILNVYDYFEENATAYIVMEFLDGITLHKYLSSDDVDAATAVEITESICNALKDVHAAGIIHRDVSPDNIFLCTNGNVKLIDFGAARFSKEEEDRDIILKPGFAPPEQYVMGGEQGPWTDIYGLGATFYYMLVGLKPEEASNRKVSDSLAPPHTLHPNIPEYLSNIVMRAIAIEPALRFQTIVEFEKALQQEKRVLAPAQEKKQRKVKRLVGILAVALVAVLASIGFFVPWYSNYTYTHLPKAEIEIWYQLPDDPALAEAKTKAMEAIIAAFQEKYKEKKDSHKVIVKPVGKSQLALRMDLQSAADKSTDSKSQMPALFESTGIAAGSRIMEKTSPLDGALKRLNEDIRREDKPTECLFIADADYQQAFSARRRLPTGFRVPVFYVNRTLVNVELLTGDAVPDAKAMAEILAANTMLHTFVSSNQDVRAAFRLCFKDALGSPAIPPVPNGREFFLNGEAAAYFSDTTDYPALKSNSRLFPIAADRIPAFFSDYWSIGKCDKKQLRCAEAFLCFLLTNNAQAEMYYKSGRQDTFPLEKKAFESYQNQNAVWKTFFGKQNIHLKNYTFSPNLED